MLVVLHQLSICLAIVEREHVTFNDRMMSECVIVA